MSNLTVGDNIKITAHFALRLQDGSEVDSNFGGKPAVWVYGDGNLPEGFESFLKGMKAGDKNEFEVPPEKAFGQHNPSNVQMIARKQFDESIELKEGLVVSFADANNNELPGVVKSFNAQNVEVDFNHPLAGETLRFEVHILQLDNAES